MPLDSSDFPYEIQVAFFIYHQLAERWEGMSGTYMGKDWTHCPHLFEVFEVEDKKTTIIFMKIIESIMMKQAFEEQERKRQADERKRQQSSGKTYAHNVRG